jgi:hypothetical protein
VELAVEDDAESAAADLLAVDEFVVAELPLYLGGAAALETGPYLLLN